MFPGAGTDRDAADYAIVGAPLDASTTFRPGTRFGPSRVREAARPFEDFDHHTGTHFSELGVFDHGDIEPGSPVPEYLDFLTGTIAEYFDADIVPLLLGGEHTVSIAGTRAVDPDVYVCLDAHLDIRESYDGDDLSHATVSHHVRELADELVILGARAGTETEWHRASSTDVTVVPPADVGDWTPAFENQDVYLSVDIDAADPGFAPGTGTPEPFGLDPTTMHHVVRAVAPYSCAFDLVEVNDRDNGQAAALGAKLLRAFVYAHGAAHSST